MIIANVVQEINRIKPSVASLTGSGLNFLVGRVSYTFGLQGEWTVWPFKSGRLLRKILLRCETYGMQDPVLAWTLPVHHHLLRSTWATVRCLTERRPRLVGGMTDSHCSTLGCLTAAPPHQLQCLLERT